MPAVSYLETVVNEVEQVIRRDERIVDAEVSQTTFAASERTYGAGVEMDSGLPSKSEGHYGINRCFISCAFSARV